MKGAALLLFFLVGDVLANSININEAVDQLLASGRQILEEKGQDKIKMKDLNKIIRKRIWGVPVIGIFTATGGKVEDLATLHRTGDVTMAAEGNTLRLDASMGLGILKASYDNYSFNMLAIRSKGSISAQCYDNAVSVKIRLVYSGPTTCQAFIDSASLDRLGKFSVSMTGPGSLNQLGDLLLNWILTQFNDHIRAIVNQRLQSSLQQAVSRINICKMIPSLS